MNSINNKPTSNTTAINRRSTNANRQEKLPKSDVQVAKPSKPTKWVQLRIIPIWLRIIIIAALAIAVMIVGYNIGYSVVGDGESSDKFATLRHMLDIINGKE
jgi:hypothetical protein